MNSTRLLSFEQVLVQLREVHCTYSTACIANIFIILFTCHNTYGYDTENILQQSESPNSTVCILLSKNSPMKSLISIMNVQEISAMDHGAFFFVHYPELISSFSMTYLNVQILMGSLDTYSTRTVVL
jgi:hypothetical protein